MTSTAYTRRKEPERVRQALIDATAALVAERGLANVTVAAVAGGAGVTKGALFHHFSDREALIAAMFDGLLEQIDRQLASLMAADPHAHGRFTRAYVNAALAPDDAYHGIWAALIGSLVQDNALTRRWQAWVGERLMAHPDEHEPILAVVRLAADGAWLAATTGVALLDLAAVRSCLIDLIPRARSPGEVICATGAVPQHARDPLSGAEPPSR